MSEALIIGLLITIIQAAFWLWVKTSMAKVDKLESNLTAKISKLEGELVAFMLAVSDHYVKQSQLDAHMDRIDKSLDEIKAMILKLADSKAR